MELDTETRWRIPTKTEFEIAPCLKEGPLAEVGRELVTAAKDLGRSPRATVLRTWCVAHLFERQEEIFSRNTAPTAALVGELGNVTQFFRVSIEHGLLNRTDDSSNPMCDGPTATVEEITGNHYGHLFDGFSDTSYWQEAAYLLRLRLERNGIEINSLADKSVLDAGCGGGRYAAAWRLLGARPVLGLDVSPLNIASAGQRTSRLDQINFEVADVLDLPVNDSSYDVVFSNGVLHHTSYWRKGVSELCRVLKPRGLGWLYVIEKPGGLFWDLIEVLRVVMNQEDHEAARLAMSTLGLPGNRVFYMLDHVMAPINERLTSAEVEQSLKEAGATQIRRLLRGVDFDRVERIYQRDPFAVEKYGIGENRFVFSKA